MREISLDRLRTLVAIAEQASFAEAARLLNLAPPTISLHVAELEARFGTRLLSRTRGQVRPTAAGDTLLRHARQLLAAVDRAIDDVTRTVEGQAGRVRLGASTGAIAHLLPQALETLGRTHPDINVEIEVLTSQTTLDRLQAGSLDIGLIALPQGALAGLHIDPWRRDPVMAFLPAGWACPAVIEPAWLAAQPLILNDRSTRLHRQTQAWFAGAGYSPEARIELNYNDAIKSLVAAGYGATLLPHEASAPDPEPHIQMRPLHPPLWRELGLARRDETPDGPIATVLAALDALGMR